MTDRVLWGGRYALFDEIAAGGMATVYLAARLDKSPTMPAVVALKKLAEALAKQPEFVAMFLDEAHIAARIRHPNVVTTYEFLRTDEGLGIVMDLVVGESFVTLLRGPVTDVEPAPLLVSTAILVGALEGLHAAHEVCDATGRHLGLIHRDMSPHNIIVGADGVARVIDFGIAKAAGRLQTTDIGVIKGKFAYMSPEQIHGAALDRATDIYAAGIVLWEAVVGRQLFRASTNQELLTKRSAGDVSIPPPRMLNEAVPPELEAIVLRALENDPRKRFLTAHDMAVAIRMEVGVADTREVATWVRQRAGPRLDLLEARRREIVASMEPTLAEAAGVPPPRRAVFGEELVLSSGPTDRDTGAIDLEGPLSRPTPPPAPFEPPRPASLPPRSRPPLRTPAPRSFRGVAAVVGAVLLVAAGAGAFLHAPAMVEERVRAAAAERGLVVTMDRAEPTRSGAVLHGVRVSLAGCPNITLSAPEVTLDHLGDLRRASIPGYELAASGPVADLAAQVDAWRRARHEPLVVDATGGHLVWTNALTSTVSLEALAVSLGILPDGALTLDTASLLVALPRGHAGPWHAHLDTSPTETRVRVGFDAASADAPASATFIRRELDGSTWSIDIPRASTFKIGVPSDLFGLTSDLTLEAVLRAHAGPTGSPFTAEGHVGLYGVQVAATAQAAGGAKPVDLVVSGNVSGNPATPLPIQAGRLAIGKTSSVVSGTLSLAATGLRVQIERPAGASPLPSSPSTPSTASRGAGAAPALVLDTRAWTDPPENPRPIP